MTARGRFITLEGGEGAGKSAQARALGARLEYAGVTVKLTREPGGSALAEALREIILSGAAAKFGAAGEALLFSAARIDHIDQTIEPALQRGEWVISDRFADSTRAYQGAAGRLDGGFIRRLEQVVLGERKPDLTLILDLPPEVGLARASERRGAASADRFEAEDVSFHAALRAAFLEIAHEEPHRCAVIDASRSIAAVSDAIWAAIVERLGVYLVPDEVR